MQAAPRPPPARRTLALGVCSVLALAALPSALPGRAAAVPGGAVDVRALGAKGDGLADDTSAIQAALDAGAGRTVFVPPGTYLVLADGYRDGGRGGVTPRSNTRLVLAPGAVLKAKRTRSSDYVVVRLERVSHVTIQGGTIQGDRDEHLGREGEWGFGIGIFGATDVVIEDVTLRDCWGDGVFVEEAQPGVSGMARNVTLRRVVSTNNRRQGMSVLGVDGLTVIDSVFERTHGTPPSAGVDIEPGGYGHAVRNVTFLNCTFRDNAGRGIVADATTGSDIAAVKIVGGSSTGNGWEGIVFHRATGGGLVAGVAVRGNGATGIYLRRSANVTAGGNHVDGNSQRADSTFSGIHVHDSHAIFLRDNVVRSEERARRQRYGVELDGSTEVTVSHNDLRRSGRNGELSVDRPSGNGISANLLGPGTEGRPEIATRPQGGRVRLDASLGSRFVVTSSDGRPFSVEEPASAAAGRRIRVEVRNAAAGPLAAVAFGEGFAAPPWSSLAAGASRSLDFVYDGARWVEIARSGPEGAR